MPTYLYECPIHKEFEEYHSITIKLTHCPQCKEAGKKQAIKRLIPQGGSKGVVELTGHELTEKTRADAQQFKRDVYSNEKLYANVVSDNTYQNLQRKIDKHK